jgi:hypothetical protein
MSERTSIFLEKRCEILGQALIFFAGEKGSHAKPGREKRLMFLSQIEYWDWEMDELIFSFETFRERAEKWRSNKAGIEQVLRSKGILVKINQFDLNWWRGWNRGKVVAPFDKLNTVIKQWNDLLTFCEQTLLQKGLEDKKEQFGMNVETNLDKFRKKEISSE